MILKMGKLYNYRKNIDVCYSTWVSITCREGINNCVNMLGTSHMAYYLDHNMYGFSNQAWECLQKRVKRMYLQKNTKGGHGKHILEAYLEYDHCTQKIPIAR